MHPLLTPRYECIAEDTSGKWKKGDIYTFVREVAQTYVEWRRQDGVRFYFEYFDKYPHLFRRLEWWERRKEEEMPEYVHLTDKELMFHGIFKVKEWNYLTDDNIAGFDTEIEGEEIHMYMYDTIPATEAEYNEYIKNK